MISNAYSKDQSILVILKKVTSSDEASTFAEKIKKELLVPNGFFGYKVSVFNEKVNSVHLILEVSEMVPFLKIIDITGKCKIKKFRTLSETIPECASFIAMKRKERSEQAKEKEEQEKPVKKVK